MGKVNSRKRDQFDRRSRKLAEHPTEVFGIERVSPPSHSYKKNIIAKTPEQGRLIVALEHEGVSIAVGPAGTGKTYLSIAKAIEALEQGRVDRIVLCRPAIEAGETIGFLPGNIEAKLAPYLRPMYDVLTERLGAKRVKTLMAEGVIEIAPIAYLRGRTFNNAFVVVDEAQNCTYIQLKMLVTRYGWNSTLVLAGDPDQSDLLPGMSGLTELLGRLKSIPSVNIISFQKDDVIRHPLVAAMLEYLD
ncbi:MAG: PhoH family protein [Candidatus Azotimanducaceae bacterium]